MSCTVKYCSLKIMYKLKYSKVPYSSLRCTVYLYIDSTVSVPVEQREGVLHLSHLGCRESARTSVLIGRATVLCLLVKKLFCVSWSRSVYCLLVEKLFCVNWSRSCFVLIGRGAVLCLLVEELFCVNWSRSCLVFIGREAVLCLLVEKLFCVHWLRSCFVFIGRQV